MMKEQTRYLNRIIFICTLLLGTSNLSAQTLVYSEDFNNCALPTGWTNNIVGNQDAIWYVDLPQNTNSDGSTIDGTCMLIIDDDATGNNTDPWVLQVISSPFNGLNYEHLELSVDVHFRNIAATSFKIKVFDGTTYHTVADYTGNASTTGEQFSEFVTFTTDISFYASNNMSIMFEYDDDASFGWWAGVDNISVIGSGDGTNVLTETFNDCSQSNWTTEVLNGNDDWQFGYVDNANAWETNSMNGSCFAYFDDDGIGQDADYSTVRLISPVIDGSQFANFRLDFDLIFRQAVEAENLSVFVFDGNQTQQVTAYLDPVAGNQFGNYESISLDLSPFRSQQMQIIFQYDDGNSWGWWVGIDNIKVVGSGSLNDLCSNAISINLNEPCLAGNNRTAIYSGATSTCFDENVGSLWYQYQSNSNGILKINTAANFNDLITVFEGDCNSMTEVDCSNRDEHGFTGETHYMTTTIGTNYLIRVNGIVSDFGVARGDFCLSLEEVNTFPTQPANDLCIDAISLVIDATNCTTGNNYNADFEGPEPSLNLKSRADIWYAFSATANSLEIKTEADFADVITVFSGDCNNLSEFDMNQFGQSLLLNDLVIGETYYIQLAGFFATVEGNVCMRVETVVDEVATNDLCPNATYVELDVPCVFGDNTFAEFEGPTPSCEIFPTANIWFEFTAPSSGAVQMNTGSTFPHVVAIYSGDCDSLVEISCVQNPVYCGGYFPVYDLTPGQNYFMQIASAENEFGYLLGELCLSIVDIESTQIFDPLEIVVTTNCIDDGVSVLEVLTYGGVGVYTHIGNVTGDTLTTGESYFVILSDELGCEVSLTGVVNCGTLPCVLGAEIASSNVSCYNDNDGIATVDVSAAENGPFSFEWSTGAAVASIDNLAPGNYSVTVIDDTGCAEIYGILISEPAPLTANATVTGETATGANDGTATANPTGGNLPYSYLWSNGSSTSSINNLAPDNYTVTITDANGCSTIESVIVSSFDCAINLAISSINISCFGNTDGQATAEITNGTPPFNYSWSTGESGATIENLSVGSYSVTIQDANGCPSIETVFISQPDEAVGTIVTQSNVTCNGTASGAATVNVNGGTAPYSFTWPDATTGPEHTALATGVYIVSFLDNNGCSGTIEVTIAEPPLLIASIADQQDVTCFDGDDGAATVFIEGGTAGYTYLWDDDLGQTTSTASNLAIGDYSVVVSDINGCTSLAQVSIEQPSELILTIDNLVDEIGEMQNGSVEVTASGGIMDYNYEWLLNGTFFSNDEDIYNLSAGNYNLVLTDANGCVVYTENIVVGSMVSLNDSDLESSILLLPNPTDGQFMISLELDRKRNVKIEIYDVLGRQLLTTDKELVQHVVYPFDLTDFAAGIYAVRVYLDGEVLVKKVVKNQE